MRPPASPAPRTRRLLPALLLLLRSAAAAASSADDDAACAADAGAAPGAEGCLAAAGVAGGSPPAYHWPRQKGTLGREGFSPYVVPSKLEAGPSWTWEDPHNDVIRCTPLIDDKFNIYLSTIAGRIYKFSPAGKMMWKRELNDSVPIVPSIFNGSLFLHTRASVVISLDMETGEDRWRVKPFDVRAASDTACNLIVDGLVVFATNGTEGIGGHGLVVAVRTTDGSLAWSFAPRENLLYNFQASSPGDGTIVFQDQAGGAYRLNATDGSLLWRTGVLEAYAMTTAAAVVHAGMVLVASNWPKSCQDFPGDRIRDVPISIPGVLVAYNLSNGHKLWHALLPHMANQAVAIGPLGQGQAPAAVIGFGTNPGLPIAYRWLEKKWPLWLCKIFSRLEVFLPWLFASSEDSAMRAINLTNGETLWHFQLDPFRKPATAGDSERFWARLEDLISGENQWNDPFCLPDSSSQPVIAGDGTAYQIWQDGRVYAVRDADGNGEIARGAEVSSYDLKDGAQGSVGLAPGMMAVAPCGGGLYVFKNAAGAGA